MDDSSAHEGASRSFYELTRCQPVDVAGSVGLCRDGEVGGAEAEVRIQ